MSRGVFVPMQLEALVLEKPDQGAGTGMPTRDKEFPLEARKKGIHLHWALPSALTKATGLTPTSTTTLQSRPAPDLWLIMRFNPPAVTGLLRGRPYTAWILSSRTGVTTPLTDWKGLQVRSDSVRVVNLSSDAKGPTSTVFADVAPPTAQGLEAAYYPTSTNRFGFFDPMTDSPERLTTPGPYSYLVVGWYSVANEDPLTQDSCKAQEEVLALLKWRLDAEGGTHISRTVSTPSRRTARESDSLKRSASSSSTLNVPGFVQAEPGHVSRATFLHGLVCDIAWCGGGGSLQGTGKKRPESVRYSVDESLERAMAEALATDKTDPQAANRMPDPQAANRMHVLLSGLARELTGQDDAGDLSLSTAAARQGFQGLAHRLHARSFGRVAGEKKVTWTCDVLAQAPKESDTRRAERLQGIELLKTVIPRQGSPLWVRDLRPDAEDESGNVTRHPMDPDCLQPGLGRRFAVRGAGLQALYKRWDDSSPRLNLSGASKSTSPSSGRDDLNVPTGLFASVGQAMGTSASAQGNFNLSTGISASAGQPTAKNTPTQGNFKLPSSPSELVVAPPAPPPPLEPFELNVQQRTEYGASWYYPNSPAVVIHGLGRGFRYGNDGRFEEDGFLRCRWEEEVLTSMVLFRGEFGSCEVSPIRILLGRSLFQKSPIPAAILRLVDEAILMDPCNASLLFGLAYAKLKNDGETQTEYSAAVEKDEVPHLRLQMLASLKGHLLWTDSPMEGGKAYLDFACYLGTLPSPIAMTPWTQPWNPLFIDIEYTYTPCRDPKAPRSAVPGWTLGTVEWEPVSASPLAVDRPIPLVERHLLTGVIPKTIASVLTPDVVGFDAHDNPTSSGGVATEDEVDETLADLDLLATTLNLDRVLLAAQRPSRAGFISVSRLRVVDTFGSVVTLVGGTSRTLPGAPLFKPPSVPSELKVPDWVMPFRTTVADAAALLTPRLPYSSRLHFRLMAADGTSDWPDQEADPDHTCVCGYLLPDFVDNAIEFLTAEGESLGQLRSLDGKISWESPPGESETDAKPNPDLWALKKRLLDGPQLATNATPKNADADYNDFVAVLNGAQAVMQRRSMGTEHLPALVGRPLALVRARIRLEVSKPVEGRPTRETLVGETGAPDRVFPSGLKLRLGDLYQTDDGLVGYLLRSELSTIFHPTSPALCPKYTGTFVAQTETLIDLSGETAGKPEAKVIDVLLLMDPFLGVHATTGVLPRKRIVLPRDQVIAAVHHMQPTFAFGPLLVNPDHLQLPAPVFRGFEWRWVTRSSSGEFASAEVRPSDGKTHILTSPAVVQRGWLRLKKKKKTATS